MNETKDTMMDDEMDTVLRGRKLKKYTDHTFRTIREEYDLKQIEIEILFCLYKNPKATSSDVYRELSLHKGHVSMAMDDLCQKGYLQSEHDRHDRRYVNYEITEKGKPVAEEIAAIRGESHSKIFEGVSEEEMDILKSIMAKVSGNLDKICED